MLYKPHIQSKCLVDKDFILQQIKPEVILGDTDLNYTLFL